MRWFPSNEFAPFNKIDTRNESLYGSNTSFWKKEIKTDAKKYVRNNKEDEYGHFIWILLNVRASKI